MSGSGSDVGSVWTNRSSWPGGEEAEVWGEVVVAGGIEGEYWVRFREEGGGGGGGGVAKRVGIIVVAEEGSGCRGGWPEAAEEMGGYSGVHLDLYLFIFLGFY